jgi:hypothetical protein
MSELPELGRGRLPGAAPHPEVLQAIVQQGRRRLRRAALGGGGALVTVVGLVLGTALLGAGTDDALVVVPASPLPGGSASPSPTAAPEPGDEREPEAGTGGAPSLRPEPQLQPQPGAQRGGPPDQPSVGAAAPFPQPDGGRTSPKALPAYREEPGRGRNGDACLGSRLDDAAPGYSLCLTSRTRANVTRDVPVTSELELCSSLRNPGTLRLSFPSGREHDQRVRRARDADDYLWTWSRHYRFPEGAHQRELPAGDCLSWRTTWNTRDDAGALLPTGEYVVDSGVLINGSYREVSQPIRVVEPSPTPEPPPPFRR